MLIVGFAVTVAIWPGEVVSCRDFILRAVAPFWAMSLVGITLAGPHERLANNMNKVPEIYICRLHFHILSLHRLADVEKINSCMNFAGKTFSNLIPENKMLRIM